MCQKPNICFRGPFRCGTLVEKVCKNKSTKQIVDFLNKAAEEKIQKVDSYNWFLKGTNVDDVQFYTLDSEGNKKYIKADFGNVAWGMGGYSGSPIFNSNGEMVEKIIETSAGKVIFNELVPDEVGTYVRGLDGLERAAIASM